MYSPHTTHRKQNGHIYDTHIQTFKNIQTSIQHSTGLLTDFAKATASSPIFGEGTTRLHHTPIQISSDQLHMLFFFSKKTLKKV